MTWHGPIEQIDESRFQIPATYQSDVMKRHGLRMLVPGLIYADRQMLSSIIKDNSPEQVANVATLPGIVRQSMAMPDIHRGYGFAIGGVAAFDAHQGVISPGGVGYDINCGVRLMTTALTIDELHPKLQPVVDTMFRNVPSGVGSEGKIRLSREQVDAVLAEGARWAVQQGYGWQEDVEFLEENGCIAGADPALVSKHAKDRGASQLGTLGAGNHFLEIQQVDEIYDPDVARVFGVTEVGQVTVMIHTGSRGCGHQICTDYLDVMRRANQKYGIPLVDHELSCAPADSPEARQYFAAMKAGANYAWANRQIITHWVRESFETVLGLSAKKLGLHLVYDIAHNMAKLEEHEVDDQKRKLYVHRKGATRAFGPGHPAIPDKYRPVGQPVLIPGDMGTASYLLVGTEQAMRESFGSSCHGAGRHMSRMAAKRYQRADQVVAGLEQRGIYLRAKSRKVIAEEAPEAYKDIDEVVKISHQAGLARKVARMKPVGVVKG